MKDGNNDNKNNNHLSLSSSSNHTRKDTPTPNDKNRKSFGAKKNKKKWYKPGVNVINPPKNQEKNMLLKSRDSPLSRTAPQLVDKNKNNNLSSKRCRFSNHAKMHYVDHNDDDESDISSVFSNKTSKTNKSNKNNNNNLQRRRITYTKSANNVFSKTSPSPSPSMKKYKANNNNNQIPTFFMRQHSKSFSVQKAPKKTKIRINIIN